MTEHNTKLFQDPHLNYPGTDLDLDFGDYITNCRSLIQSSRPDLQGPNPSELILNANSPYEFKPLGTTKARYGALLIHGLYDTPFIMRDLGKLLQTQGFLARSVLLPGHGTVPGALLNVQHEEWLQTVRYGIKSLSHVVDKIFLVGFSIGGCLALSHLLAESHSTIAGTILLAPALKISPLATISNLPPKLGKHWMEIEAEVDYAKYRSFTYNSVYQAYLLTEKLNTLIRTKTLHCPLFISISRNDKTVCSQTTLNYFQQHATKDSELIFYTNKTSNLDDKRITQRPTNYPQFNINDISHIALPVAPDNPHYGQDGDYCYASHIKTQSENWYGAYTPLQQDIFNLLHNAGLIHYHRSRLTYNPDFEFMRERIIQFIQKIK